MGMYDNFGPTQVKCFFVPHVFWSRERGKIFDEGLDVSYSGGSLLSFKRGKEVPYKTPYYCYGENFMIYDFRTWNDSLPEDVIVIEDGKWSFSAPYSSKKIKDKISTGKFIVVDKYGDRINITEPEDFENIYQEFRQSEKEYDSREKAYRKSIDHEYADIVSSFGKEGRPSSEGKPGSNELKKFFDDIEKNSRAIFNETLGKFNDKWYIRDPYEKYMVLGAIWYVYLTKDISDNDWKLIISDFARQVKERFGDFNAFVDEYLAWCKNNNIDVDECRLRNFIKGNL